MSQVSTDSFIQTEIQGIYPYPTFSSRLKGCDAKTATLFTHILTVYLISH